MGVKGLTTYINSNQDVFMKKYYLHDTKLIIDGLSLCSQLYRSLNCFSAFGGDYDKYATYVKNFFKSLRKCNITSYVIFDGSYERRKIKTVYARLRTKLKNASQLDPVTQGSLQIFPLLLREVFRDILLELNIAHFICDFEADDEIASLARHLNCPVLSYDSDFFIYNVLYIPFNTLELKPKAIEIQGERRNVMECKLFQVQHLTKHFGGIQEDLLPLLAILLGNDYIEKKVFNKFFSQLKLQKFKKKKNDQQRSIHSLFNWLQNETLESAIVKILGRLKKNKKKKVLYIIKNGIEGYNSKKCLSLEYFNIDFVKVDSHENNEMKLHDIFMDEVILKDEASIESQDSSDDNEDCSDSDKSDENIDENDFSGQVNSTGTNTMQKISWFVEKVQKNLMPVSYLNLYTNHIYFCSPQADDYTDEDPFLCTLTILRYAYDILTDFNGDNCIYIGRDSCTNYRKFFVEKDIEIPRPIHKKFCDLSIADLHQYFYNFLNIKMPNLDLNKISLLPTNFQLFMISILWWIKYCNVPITHIHSLILSYITLEIIDEKTGTPRGHFHFNNKNSKKLADLRQQTMPKLTVDDVNLNKNKVQYEDCLIAASVLLKHFEIDDSIRKKPKSYDVKRIHSFAQFQCCLQQLNSLNILCGSPFVKTIYNKCYNGTLIYNFALKMEKHIDPEQFIEQYLFGATSVLLFYKSICAILNKIMEQMCLKTATFLKKKRRNRNKDDEISLILKGLESDVVI